jgi:hypothetical protein
VIARGAAFVDVEETASGVSITDCIYRGAGSFFAGDRPSDGHVDGNVGNAGADEE